MPTVFDCEIAANDDGLACPFPKLWGGILGEAVEVKDEDGFGFDCRGELEESMRGGGFHPSKNTGTYAGTKCSFGQLSLQNKMIKTQTDVLSFSFYLKC